MKDLIVELRALYGSSLSRATKLAERERAFACTRKRLSETRFETPGWGSFDHMVLNNAFLATVDTYDGNSELFEAIYTSVGRDLARFVALMRDVASHHGDPRRELAQLAARANGAPAAAR
jgi:predicted aminopeptidase